MKTMYHSCYICDVKVDYTNKLATLMDSSHNQYFIELSDKKNIEEFENWFKNIFSKGVAQTLTIFQYTTKDVSECETEMYIIKFLNLSNTQKTFV